MAQTRDNLAKRKLERGEIITVIEGQNSTHMIDFVGQFGFDAVWIETEHGPIDFADIPDLTRAAGVWDMTPLVRVNLHEPGVVYRTLDVGAQGVIVPHVNTEAEARAIVDAAKYHPIGARGMYSSRQGYGVEDYIHKANDQTMIIILIEDIVAVNNLDDILKVDNIDVFFVAPGDLSQSMGHLGDISHPDVQSTIDATLEKIHAAGRISGTVVNDATVESYIEKGVKFLMNSWLSWVGAGAQNYLSKVSAAAQRVQ